MLARGSQRRSAPGTRVGNQRLANIFLAGCNPVLTMHGLGEVSNPSRQRLPHGRYYATGHQSRDKPVARYHFRDGIATVVPLPSE